MARRSRFPRHDVPSGAPRAPDDHSGSRSPDWPAQAADLIVEQVDRVRARTTGPAIRVARLVVFSAFASLLGAMAFVLLVIAAVRVIDVYLPEAVFGGDNTWAAYCILGGILVFAGLLTGRKMSRSARP